MTNRADQERRPTGAARRDFLYLATGSVAVFGLLSVAWPFIDQMNPDAATLAQGEPVDIDLSNLEPGQQITVIWRGRAVFVVHRTAAALNTLEDSHLVVQLADPDSEQHQQPRYAQNWHRSIKPPYLVVVGICTHLGCIPGYRPQPGSVDAQWLGGFFCPCHGSKYDLAGRVYKAVPAPFNLPVPPYRYLGDNSVRIGANPPGQTFDFASIEQL